LIKKIWAKFDGMDLVCLCDEHDKKCDGQCKEYVVKFTEVKRNKKAQDASAHIKREADNLRREIRKFQSQVSRSVRKFKI